MTENSNNSEVVGVTESTENNNTNVTDTKTINFLDTLNEDLRNEPALKDFKDVNGLAKSYISANKMIGRSDIPNEKSTKEDWDKFYKKLGRPEKGYTLADNLEETEELKALKENCFKSGLSQKQFDNVVKTLQDIKTQEENSTKERAEKFLKEFETTFGENVNAVRENAKALISKYTTEEDREVLNTLNEQQVIAFTKLLNNIGNVNVKEGQLVSGVNNNKTLKEMYNRIQEIKKSDAFWEDNKELQDLSKEMTNRYLAGEKMY